VLTHVHSLAAIGAYTVVFGAVLARLRERYWILTLALSVGGTMVLNVVLKNAYERARPRFDEPLVELVTYSFPSGHTAAAVAFYGVLAAFLVSRFYDLRVRAACVAGAIAMVALVAFSRVYLGAHYLSDVLAAACSGTVWLVLCLAAGHSLVRRTLKRRWIVLGAAALAALIAASVLPLEDWSARLEEALGAMGFLQGLALFTAVQIVAMLVLVPAWVFPLVAGAVFGLAWGFLAAMAGSLASALLAFLLARTVLRGLIARAARRNKLFKALDAAVAKEGFKVVALVRLSPVLPSGMKSYFLGLTRVRLVQYACASTVAMLPGVFLKVYIGAAGRGALTEGGVLNWTLFAAGVAATVALTVLLGRKARRVLKFE
jgi:undecaprenyl-diphosphatase